MSPSEKWFGRVVWLGVIFNLCFALPAMFAPDFLAVEVGLGPDVSGVWLQNVGMLLVALCLFYICSRRPTRTPLFARITVLSRLIAAAFWLWVWRTSGQPSVFRPFFFSDFTFGVVLAILLRMALPAGQRLTFQTVGQDFHSAGASIASAWHRTAVKVALAVILVVGGVLGYEMWYNLMRTLPDTSYPTDPEQFEHGAIGLAPSARLPYWIFKVLPTMFPEKLPAASSIAGGWASFGFIIEPGSDIPVGFSLRTTGYPALEANCSLCHTGTYRATSSSPPVLVLGAPAHTLDLESFQWFLYDSASDPRFTPDNVIAAIDHVHPMGFFESLAYRYLIIPGTKEGLLQQKAAYSWQKLRPAQGRGRVDTFNPTKFNVYHMPDDGTIGTVDLPQIWNQRPRIGLWLHWDGNNNSLQERNYAAAMAVGATPKSVIPANFTRVTNFLLDLKPASYPFPINQPLAAQGKPIYEKQCASCHEFGQPQVGEVTDISQIGTDRHRLDSFTQGLVDKFHEINFGPPFNFSAYRKTDGYADTPLDGVWMRAPYLHNGSVPTLWDLLQPADKRPTAFYKGYDVYDPKNVGFITAGPDAERVGFLLQTCFPGNGNGGHLYGVDLTDKEKWALIEYMKTL